MFKIRFKYISLVYKQGKLLVYYWQLFLDTFKFVVYKRLVNECLLTLLITCTSTTVLSVFFNK